MIMQVHGYTVGGAIDVVIDGVALSVPNDPSNRHRQMIAEWEAEGNTIPAYVAPPEPIKPLEPWRFFAMLDLSGKRAGLDAFIEAMSEPAKTVAKAKLTHSLTFYRDNDLVLAAQQALGLSDAELDALWTQALSL